MTINPLKNVCIVKVKWTGVLRYRRAKICPVCNKSQGGAGKIIVLGILGLLFVFVLGSCFARGSGDGATSPEAAPAADTKTTYGQGEAWTVDGQWRFTIDSVTATDERNEFSDLNPAQVVVVTYSYENLGYTGDVQDLYFSELNMAIIDGGKAVAKTYPGNISTYPQETPNGAVCNGARQYFHLSPGNPQRGGLQWGPGVFCPGQ